MTTDSPTPCVVRPSTVILAKKGKRLIFFKDCNRLRLLMLKNDKKKCNYVQYVSNSARKWTTIWGDEWKIIVSSGLYEQTKPHRNHADKHDHLIIFTNPTIHLSHTPQCTIQNRNMHIFLPNGALWDIGQVHFGICELDQISPTKISRAVQMIISHYIDVIMTTMASQITSLTVIYSTVYSDSDQRKHQSSASLAFVWGIHRDRWIPRTTGQLRGKCFHLMTSSWRYFPYSVTSSLNVTSVAAFHCNEIPSSLYYKTHFSRQLDCWSLRCSWSIACRRCSSYIFIINLAPGFNGLGKDNYQMRREAFKFWDLVRFILKTLRYAPFYVRWYRGPKRILFIWEQDIDKSLCLSFYIGCDYPSMPSLNRWFSYTPIDVREE